MNVMSPANPDWARRRALLGRELQRLAPDIVALQEVPCRPDLEVGHELLGPGYHVTPFSRAAGGGVGGVLAPRLPHRGGGDLDHRPIEREPALPWCATLIAGVEAGVGRV